MQELAKKAVEEVDQFEAASSVDVDKLTAKQIADIDRALKGQVLEPETKDDVTKVEATKEEVAATKVEKAPDQKPEDVKPSQDQASKETSVVTPVAAKSEPVAKKATKDLPTNLSAETGAALRRFDSLLNGSAKLRARPGKDKAESKTAEAPDQPKQGGNNASAKTVENSPALSPDIAGPAEARKPVATERTPVSAEGFDPRVDFFTLRRSLRQLQFNYSINKPHDDSIKDEFDDLLANFSRMSVQYQQMNEDHAKSVEDRGELKRTQNELLDVQTELQKASQAAKNADLRRTKDLEAFAQLTARQNAARAEVKEAQEAAEAMKREMSERSQEYDSKNEENIRLAHEVSLAEAEKGVLRESLSEACDKIAELLSGEHRFESMIQELEDEVAQLKAAAGTVHSQAG